MFLEKFGLDRVVNGCFIGIYVPIVCYQILRKIENGATRVGIFSSLTKEYQ